jgi:formiminoglutamase
MIASPPEWLETRDHGRPGDGVHAIQMELAMRGYLAEPADPPAEANWPPEYDAALAAPAREVLFSVLEACLTFAQCGPPRGTDTGPSVRTIP